MRSVSARKFATLEPEERKQVIDGIYQKLSPQITKALNEHLAKVTPNLRQFVRDEIGKFAVTEKQANAFLDGMVLEAAKKIMTTFKPRWFVWFFFHR